MAPKKTTKKAVAKKETASTTPPPAKKKRITLAPEGIVMAEAAAAKKAEARKDKKSSVAPKKTKEQAVEELKKRAKEAAAKGKATKKRVTIADNDNDDNEDNVSVDLEFSDDEDGNVKIPAAKGKKGEKKEKVSHTVLQLRHLPKEFEEPQLQRFFSQFGANVVSAFCVRSKRNHQSLGTAFVQFDDNSVLPTVIDECHGMLLGGRTVRARRVRINRPLPTKKAIQARMNRAHAIEARGVKMNQFDLGKKQAEAAAKDIKKVVGYLIKYSRTETRQNDLLKELGIDYQFSGFKDQLKQVHRSHFVKPERKEVEPKKSE